MVEVVFSDSEKGAMKCAQHFGDEIGVSVGVIGLGGTQLAQGEYDEAMRRAREEEARLRREGKPLGGSPQDVLDIPFALDVGDISPAADALVRKEQLWQLLSGSGAPGPKLPKEEFETFWQGGIADARALAARAKAGEPVRLWYSDAPYSASGFFEVVARLEGCACDVSAVKLPAFLPHGEDGAVSLVSFGEVHPGQFARCLPLEQPLPPGVRRAIARHWAVLKTENAPLRAVINGRLCSVGEDFYDPFIRREIPEQSFKAANVIGAVLGKNHLAIGDWLVAARLRAMVRAGELRVVRQTGNFYSAELAKTPGV